MERVKAKTSKVDVITNPSIHIDSPLHPKPIYKEAWSYAKKNIRIFSRLVVLVIIINVVNSWFDPQSQSWSEQMQWLTSLLSLILSLASAWLSMGFVAISLKLLNNEEATTFGDGLVDLQKTIKTFFAKIIVVFFTLAWLVVFIIPGIIIQTKLMFTTTLILDQNLGIWESIKTSRAITKWSVRKLIVISLVVGIIQLLGIATLGIGLFRTIPFMNLAETLAYRTLRK